MRGRGGKEKGEKRKEKESVHGSKQTVKLYRRKTASAEEYSRGYPGLRDNLVFI